MTDAAPLPPGYAVGQTHPTETTENAQFGNSQPTLDDLYAIYRDAKLTADDAAAALKTAQAALVAHPEVQAKIAKAKSRSFGDFTVKRNIKKTWDEEKLAALKPKVKPDFWPFEEEEKTVLKVDEDKLKALEQLVPELHKEITQALTTNESAPSVSLNKKAGE